MIVEQIKSVKRNTKYGMKDAWSFKADGQWFNTGFKKPSITEGSDISIVKMESTPYGTQVNVEDIVVSAPTAGVTAPINKTRSFGKFPIAVDDGQRTICRQNALTNACMVYTKSKGEKGFALDIDVDSAIVVGLARQFEAYTCGDDERRAVEKAMEAE